MAIRFKLRDDGTPDAIETDTMDEAIKVYRQFVLKPDNVMTRVQPSPSTNAQPKHEGPREMSENARRLARLLISAPQGMVSNLVAANLKITTRGLGGFVVALNSWARSHGLSKDDVVVNVRSREGDQAVRSLRPGKELLRLATEGKIPGL